MFSLSPHAFFLVNQIRQTLSRKLGRNEWSILEAQIEQWKGQHEADQRRLITSFAKI
jgi:hypothetical protein